MLEPTQSCNLLGCATLWRLFSMPPRTDVFCSRMPICSYANRLVVSLYVCTASLRFIFSIHLDWLELLYLTKSRLPQLRRVHMDPTGQWIRDIDGYNICLCLSIFVLCPVYSPLPDHGFTCMLHLHPHDASLFISMLMVNMHRWHKGCLCPFACESSLHVLLTRLLWVASVHVDNAAKA